MEIFDSIYASFVEIMQSKEIIDIIVKAVLSLSATAITTLIGILFGKCASKMKNSKIMKDVITFVKAAEQEYPNVGTKMGDVKYQYVLGNMIAKYPQLAENPYMKDIIEATVWTVINDREEQASKEEEKKIARKIKRSKTPATEDKTETVVQTSSQQTKHISSF